MGFDNGAHCILTYMKNAFRKIRSLFALFIFSLAIWILHKEFSQYHVKDIVGALSEINSKKLFAALALTILNYLLLGGYEILGFRYINRPVRHKRVLLTSFITYALTNNVGFSPIFGTSSRYHLYSSMELTLPEIANLVIFSSLTFFLGLLCVAGITFVFEPINIPQVFHLPLTSSHTLGIIFLSLIAIYLFWSIIGKGGFRIKSWSFKPPPFHIAAPQIILSSLDWIMTGAVLYILLPDSFNMTYPVFLASFLFAQTIGLISQSPGGLGVFEAALIALAPASVASPHLLASLLCFRVIYYLFPLCVATLLLAAREIFRRNQKVKEISDSITSWIPTLVPQVLALNSFIAGSILLFSGALPSQISRLAWLKDLIPLPVIEISHFLGSFTGMILLLLARGLQRRLDAAYFLACSLLSSGIIFSLLKGFDYEEAIILSVMLVALIPSRRYFYRKASLTGESFTPVWAIAIIVVLVSSLWIGFFSYQHIEYSKDLWWRFALVEDAPRFLRATVGVLAAALFFAIARLLRPATIHHVLPELHEMDKARKVIEKSKTTIANLALLGDKSFLFSDTENSFIMYGIRGRSWIALGNPVGGGQEHSELIWQFRELCDRHDAWTIFWQVGKEDVDLYLDVGLALLKIGEEARVPLTDFSLKGNARKDLRYTFQHLEKNNLIFEIVPKEGVGTLLPQLKQISDDWLTHKHTKEKGFSLGFFKEDYLCEFSCAVVKKNETILAFSNIWAGAEKEEVSIDLMRHSFEAPQGIMDFLLIHLMFWGSENGFKYFNLGMAPLAGLENRTFAPIWNRIGAFVFGYGEHFYNFQGLRKFKDKFHPIWEPKFLASPGGLVLPSILADIAAFNSGSIKGVFSK